MTNEQQQIQQYVAQLIEAGNATILQRNSRARKLPFGVRLREVVTAMFLPLALIFMGVATTGLVWWLLLVAFSL